MAVRDFVDASGMAWRVWPVTPEALQPKTAAEDYLGEYGEGWLCFESATERRRLARYPVEWEELSDAELCTLLKAAALVPARKSTHLPPPDAPNP
ncbi:MAG: hypothetical protein ABR499_21625 [Gemmatimonadaceae bacterium]